METNFVVSFGVLTAVVIGLVEIVKKFGVPEKLSALSGVVLGIIFALLQAFSGGSTDLFSAVVGGIVIGLTAVGLYSGVKNTSEAFFSTTDSHKKR